MLNYNRSYYIHFVCTYQRALELINQNTEYYISDCESDEREGSCSHSNIEACLIFNKTSGVITADKRKIEKEDAIRILKEAAADNLVPIEFREIDKMDLVEGIYFCCEDCCSYFINEEEKCDKGEMIEKTNINKCIQCGECTKVCYFKCREYINEKLIINGEKCFGCGLCVDICPINCIEMIARQHE